jgi:hypothetical protein
MLLADGFGVAVKGAGTVKAYGSEGEVHNIGITESRNETRPSSDIRDPKRGPSDEHEDSYGYARRVIRIRSHLIVKSQTSPRQSQPAPVIFTTHMSPLEHSNNMTA